MFRVSWVIRSTLTPAPKVTSYRVTVGPRLNPVTAQSTPNSANTCWTAAMTSSFACVCCRWGWPVRSSLRDGKVYMPAPPLSSNWIGRLIGGCSGSVADRLEPGPARARRTGWAPARSPKRPARTATTGIGPVPASSTPRTAPRLAVSARPRLWSPAGSVPTLGGPAERAGSPSAPGRRSRRAGTAAERRRRQTDRAPAGVATPAPIRPPRAERPDRDVGESDHRWSRPRTAALSVTVPTSNRPRCPGIGTCRSMWTPSRKSSDGHASAPLPTKSRQQLGQPDSDRSRGVEPDRDSASPSPAR